MTDRYSYEPSQIGGVVRGRIFRNGDPILRVGLSVGDLEGERIAARLGAAEELLAALKDIVASAEKAGVAIVDLSRGRTAINHAEGYVPRPASTKLGAT